MTGAEMIAEERLRQIREEGWSHHHDDEHPPGVLAAAADCYLYLTHAVEAPADAAGLLWPWHPSWFKPRDTRSNLIRAGALYLAEAERWKRAGNDEQSDKYRDLAADVAMHIDGLS